MPLRVGTKRWKRFGKEKPPDVEKETPEISTPERKIILDFTRRNDWYCTFHCVKNEDFWLQILDLAGMIRRNDHGNLDPSHRQSPREAPHIGTSSGILNDSSCVQLVVLPHFCWLSPCGELPSMHGIFRPTFSYFLW